MGRIPRPPGWGGNQSPTCTKPQCCLEFGALLLPPCWALGAGAKDRPVGCASAPGSVTPEVVDVGASAKLLMQMFHLCDRSLPSTQLPLPRGPILPGLRLPTYAKVLLKSQPIQLLFLPPVFPSERACVRAPLSPGCPPPPPLRSRVPPALQPVLGQRRLLGKAMTWPRLPPACPLRCPAFDTPWGFQSQALSTCSVRTNPPIRATSCLCSEYIGLRALIIWAACSWNAARFGRPGEVLIDAPS